MDIPSDHVDADRRRELLTRWAQPHRRYHTVEHLRHMLRRLDELASAGEVFDAEAVELAAWYHDAIYDIPGPDNETRSAQLAATDLAGRQCADEVVRLIELTATHVVESGDANGAALCDADLAILGSDAERYGEYARRVRDEYAAVDDELYRVGRTQVLSALLAQPSLFHTDYGKRTWETKARSNIRAEIDGQFPLLIQK